MYLCRNQDHGGVEVRMGIWGEGGKGSGAGTV